MKIFIKSFVIVSTLMLFFGVFNYANVTSSVSPLSMFAPQHALALGTSGCGDCNTGSSGGSTSGGTTSGGGGGTPAPVCHITSNITAATDGQSYTISWNGSGSGATFAVNNTPVPAVGSATYTYDGNYSYARYVLTGTNAGGTCSDQVVVNKQPVAPVCNISTNISVATVGQQYTVSWNGTPSTGAFQINGAAVPNSGSNTFTFSGPNKETFTMTGNNDGLSCSKTVNVTVKKSAPSCDSFTATPSTLPYGGGSVNLVWNTSNADSVSINNGVGTVPADGSKTVNVTQSTNYVLTVSAAGYSPVTCQAPVTVQPQQNGPSCDSFTATPSTLPYGGGSVNLVWNTSNADSVSIDHGISTVPADGSKTVTVTQSTTYTLTVYKAGFASVTCHAPVTVQPQSQGPSCDSFTASPSVLPYGGGSTNLVWNTSNADSVSIDHGVGTVPADGSKSVNVTNSTTYTLTATKAGFAPVTCPAPVTVQPQESGFSCQNNVSFTASPTSLPAGGGDVTLSWSTTGADSVAISGISNTGLSGSATVPVSSSRTYTLTATQGSQSISCPLSVSVASNPPGGGGGGGGVIWPYCDLRASAKSVQPGQSVQLTWKSSKVTGVTFGDNHGNIIFDTSDPAKFNGSMTVEPTQTTTYTFMAHGTAMDLPCTVTVNMPNTVTILQSRDQKPLMAGIALTQVPYTGFDAGPFLTFVFYALLTIWGLFVAYVFVLRRKRFAGVSLPGVHTHVQYVEASVDADPVTNESYAEEYVQSVTTEVPNNLPTAAPVVGYAAATATAEPTFEVTPMAPAEADASIAMTELENRAHAQKALLSSDAMRYFMSSVTETDQADILDAVVRAAKGTFPSEDGWVVLNLARMESLLAEAQSPAVAAPVEAPTETTPITSGSLAEAIVTGNIVAAYEMISSRPMIALADASADLDAIYRARKGATVSVSDLLQQQAAGLTDEQLHNAIAALTDALDGTYTSEAEAVKMAILKAVKAIS